MGHPVATDALPAQAPRRATGSRIYPWVVFALTFSLLLSDYMSRQVLSAVFPFLKAEWTLSDADLASLSSAVALTVGVLTLPLSLFADRWGRVRSLVLMAVLWSVATLLCAAASGYGQMLGARFLVGFGEAAYGSVGIAIVLGVFAPRVHAALSGAFMAGGSFGSVLGIALGGLVAVQLGWRWSFAVMAIFGLVLVALFAVLVNDRRLARHCVDAPVEPAAAGGARRAPISTLFTNPAVLCAYVGSGLQMFTAAVLLSWMPSFFNRYYALGPGTAALVAAGVALLIGTGMIVCGVVTDRIARDVPARKWTAAIVFCTVSLACSIAGFSLEAGGLQLALIGVGAFFSAGSSGPAAAAVARLTHSSIRASAMGTLTVANN
ncbi:MAG: MFS transporter, partial [Sciscionella sp.]